jgi:hypothetical protein
MLCSLTIVRYPKYCGWAGFLSMALFHFPLRCNKAISFYKLMGCGKNGSFDIHPDLRQWAILAVYKTAPINLTQYGKFIEWWWRFFKCERINYLLQPLEGHGKWDGSEPFGNLPKQSAHDGLIAVLTRATININRLKNFWQHVAGVSQKMYEADGFITSVGIGEMPWIKQATFSIWKDKNSMQQFAYQLKQHVEVIKKTREENWYSEELFVRFSIIATSGTLHGDNPAKQYV